MQGGREAGRAGGRDKCSGGEEAKDRPQPTVLMAIVRDGGAAWVMMHGWVINGWVRSEPPAPALREEQPGPDAHPAPTLRALPTVSSEAPIHPPTHGRQRWAEQPARSVSQERERADLPCCHPRPITPPPPHVISREQSFVVLTLLQSLVVGLLCGALFRNKVTRSMPRACRAKGTTHADRCWMSMIDDGGASWGWWWWWQGKVLGAAGLGFSETSPSFAVATFWSVGRIDGVMIGTHHSLPPPGLFSGERAITRT